MIVKSATKSSQASYIHLILFKLNLSTNNSYIIKMLRKGTVFAYIKNKGMGNNI